VVDGGDIAIVLGHWGDPGIGDLNCSGAADGGDIAIILGHWGACPAIETGGRCEETPSLPEMAFAMGGGDSESAGAWLTPEVLAALFGFESVEEFVSWLLALETDEIEELFEGLFGG